MSKLWIRIPKYHAGILVTSEYFSEDDIEEACKNANPRYELRTAWGLVCIFDVMEGCVYITYSSSAALVKAFAFFEDMEQRGYFWDGLPSIPLHSIIPLPGDELEMMEDPSHPKRFRHTDRGPFGIGPTCECPAPIPVR